MKRELSELMNNPSHIALWEKVLEGFRHISGTGWETRADYQHFWPLVTDLYRMAYGPRADLPEEFKGPLAFMLAGHTGRTRKGIRKRPYFHHILMVVYVTWVLQLSRKIQRAAISHDDIEDIPKNLDVTVEWVMQQLLFLIQEDSLKVVLNLSNKPNPGGKHAGQLEKMAVIPLSDAILKLVDRLCNLYDMRQDKPKDFGPDRIRQECSNALELVAVMPLQAPPSVLALLAFTIDMLATENNIEMAAG